MACKSKPFLSGLLTLTLLACRGESPDDNGSRGPEACGSARGNCLALVLESSSIKTDATCKGTAKIDRTEQGESVLVEIHCSTADVTHGSPGDYVLHMSGARSIGAGLREVQWNSPFRLVISSMATGPAPLELEVDASFNSPGDGQEVWGQLGGVVNCDEACAWNVEGDFVLVDTET